MLRPLAATCFLVLVTGLAAQEKLESTAKVTGLSIHKPLPTKPGEMNFSPSGTTMEIALGKPGKFILGIDTKESKLDHFTDDKKNDLSSKGKGLFGQQNWINDFMTRYSSDGSNCTVTINGANPPGKGAEKILVKGSIMVKCGAGEKATDKTDITLKMNEETKAGDFKVKVNQTSNFGSQLTIESNSANVKKVEFFGADGKAVTTFPPGRTAMPAPGGKQLHTMAYFLNGKHEKLSVKVHYFEKMENVSIPFDLSVGLDLQ